MSLISYVLWRCHVDVVITIADIGVILQKHICHYLKHDATVKNIIFFVMYSILVSNTRILNNCTRNAQKNFDIFKIKKIDIYNAFNTY